MMARPRALVWILGIALVVALVWSLWRVQSQTDVVPLHQDADGLMFANLSADHKYDRILRNSLRMFQTRTNVQLAVLLLDHLPADESIEAYSVRTFKSAGVGASFDGRGLLFVWSEQERLFKIEVGYALEGVFPDVVCRQLEAGARTFMLNQTAYARRDFLTELFVTMGIHYLEFHDHGTLSPMVVPEPGHQLTAALSGGAGIVGRGYARTLEEAWREVSPLSEEDAAAFQPDESAVVVIERYMKSLELGVGAPNLPLLTEGSRYFRLEKPHAPGYLKRIRAYQQKAMPYRFSMSGDLAAATFELNRPVLPILLRHHADGRWRVDEASAWAYFLLAQGGQSPVPKFERFPYRFALDASAFRDAMVPIYRDRVHLPALRALPFDLTAEIQAAEDAIGRAPNDADAVQRLAELVHYEIWWRDAAATLYARVLELDPTRTELRWRLTDLYSAMSDLDAMALQMEAILKRYPDDELARRTFAWLKSFR